MAYERINRSKYWIKSDLATALYMSLSKMRSIESLPDFPKIITIIDPISEAEHHVYNRREAEAFVSRYLDDKSTFCNRMAIDFVVGRY